MDDRIQLRKAIDDLNRQVEAKDEEILRGFEANERLRRESNDRLGDLQKQNRKLQAQLDTRRQSASTEDLMRHQIRELEEVNENLKKSNTILRERKQSADQQVAQLKDFVKSQGGGNSHSAMPNADLRRELTKLRAELDKANDNNYIIECEKKKFEGKLIRAEEKCEELQGDIDRKQLYIDNLAKHVDMNRRAYESLKQRRIENNEVSNEGLDLKKREQDLKEREEALSARLAKLEQDKADIHGQRKLLTDARKQHLDEQQRWAEEKNALTMENSKLKQKIVQLERTCEQLKEEKPYKSMSGPQSSYSTQRTSTRTRSSNSSSSTSDIHLFLQQQTMMVAQLQQQMFQMQNDFRRVEDRNMHYQQAAGNLQTTLKMSRRFGQDQTLEVVAQKVAELLQIGNQQSHHGDYHQVPSIPTPEVSSQFPKIAPFPKETHHHILDISKSPDANEQSLCPSCNKMFEDDKLQKHMEHCTFRKEH